MTLLFCDCSQYHNLMVFTQISKFQKCIFNHLKLGNKKLHSFVQLLVNNNNLWSCDVDIAYHLATRCHKFSWQSMILCDTIRFCVSSIYGTNIYYGMPFFFVCHEAFEVMNSYACVCVLNNLLLIVIMTTILIVVLKKVTHNSLTF